MATNFLGPIGSEWPSRYRTDVQDCVRCGMEIRRTRGPGICTDCRDGDPDYVQIVRAKDKAKAS